MKRIGFLVNPVAGMGGAVGLKGTDGKAAQARERGAVPLSPDRAVSALRSLASDNAILFLSCSGSMGENELIKAGIRDYRVVYHYSKESTAEDTRNACSSFLERGVDLILFCGGDGTARDIAGVVGTSVPVLGIPAGVKMYSAVFAVDPLMAADLVRRFPDLPLRDSEVLDIDEEAYRDGVFATRLFGIVRVPYLHEKTQVAKHVIESINEDCAKADIAAFMAEVMLPETTYILGAGTTTASIAARIGIKKTLLGVDVIRDRVLIAADADEGTLLRLIGDGADVRIIISPLGAQGFILGRGTQQISTRVLKKIGLHRIIVVATPQKLVQTPVLYVDSGDAELDHAFGDSVQVICGYRIAQRKRLHQTAVRA